MVFSWLACEIIGFSSPMKSAQLSWFYFTASSWPMKIPWIYHDASFMALIWYFIAISWKNHYILIAFTSTSELAVIILLQRSIDSSSLYLPSSVVEGSEMFFCSISWLIMIMIIKTSTLYLHTCSNFTVCLEFTRFYSNYAYKIVVL